MEYYFDYVTDTRGLFDQLDSWGDVDVDAWLEQSQKSHEERLEQELKEIREQLEGRDAVHTEIVVELEQKLEWYIDRLEKLYAHGIGQSDGKRERLQDRIEAFYREWRREQREHWQDRQQLELERRTILRELEEATDESLSDLFEFI